MPSFNQSIFHPTVFFLTGIPGFETYHAWVFIPFCCLYVIAITGNGMILFVIITESSLHEPMYYFLSMLSFSDLGLCLSTLVTVVGIFWFNAREISFDACIGQMFFIHGFTFMESSVLLAMAFDRYIAICNPLRYATILTNSRIIKVGFAIVVRVTTVVVPLLLLLKRLSFCGSHVLHHSYCFHPDVMKLSYTKINSAFGLAIVISTAALDSVLILLSYVLIIHSVLGIASSEEQKKAFGTCVSHISAVAIFYIPMISLSLVHRFGKHAPPLVHTLISCPTLFDPVDYSLPGSSIYEIFQSRVLECIAISFSRGSS
uniref:Olfactory receptor n=1 Tax=Capra hircus TaxID=9925 RepID=A0A8C2NL07_CAPHI